VDIILQGRKILKIDIGCIRFLDSLSFFQQPLANLPKAFDLGVNVKKGDFPHGVNKKKNYRYIGRPPKY